MIRPQARMIHHGPNVPTDPLRQLICDWLTANGINPSRVKPDPIYVLTIPHPNSTINGGQPHLIDVIVFTQYYDADGRREMNLLTKDAVTFQRTVPLQVPFPADPTDGEDHGQADREAAQETPEEVVRDARETGLSDPRQGSREGGPGQSEAARNESAAKEGSSSGDEAIPEPEEDRQEEVGGDR